MPNWKVIFICMGICFFIAGLTLMLVKPNLSETDPDYKTQVQTQQIIGGILLGVPFLGMIILGTYHLIHPKREWIRMSPVSSISDEGLFTKAGYEPSAPFEENLFQPSAPSLDDLAAKPIVPKW